MRRLICPTASALLVGVLLLVGTGHVGSSAANDVVAVPSTVGWQLANCPAGLTSAQPIVITAASDWGAVPGIRGSGTATDPYVISCLSISGGSASQGAAIYVDSSTASAFDIHDVQLDGTSQSQSFGIEIGGSTPAAAEIRNASISGYFPPSPSSGGVYTQDRSLTLGLSDNLLTGNSTGIFVSVANLESDANFGTSNGNCENIRVALTGSVSEDSCINNTGQGIVVAGPQRTSESYSVAVTGNVSQQNGGDGFNVADAVLSQNVSERNQTGIYDSGNNDDNDNVVRLNKGNGIDISGASFSLVHDNTAEYNVGTGIIANPTGARGFFDYDNQIFDNRVGFNGAGIATLGIASADEIWGTTWTDGHQSISDFGDQSTVVDAGSDRSASVGQPVQFNDYVDRVTIGDGTGVPPELLLQPAATPLGVPVPWASVVPGLNWSTSWDFGAPCTNAGPDGKPQGQYLTIVDPTQGHGPPPTEQCSYPAAGTYTVKITVASVNPTTVASSAGQAQLGQTQSFTDTLQVTVK